MTNPFNFDHDTFANILEEMKAHEEELIVICRDHGPIEIEDIAAVFRTLRRHRLQLEELQPFPPVVDEP
jgi:hypothetical protein